ncbi:MAG: PAS domain S-box protein [Nitrospirota bacterium]|nr:PAS domain S-box protein [Nitrospirota bacterium]
MAERSATTEKHLLRVRARQLQLLFDSLPSALVVSWLNAVVLAAVLWGEADPSPIFIWLGVVTVLTSVRLLSLRLRRPDLSEPGVLEVVEHRFKLYMGVSGVVWGASAFFLFPSGSVPHQAFLAFILGGIGAGAVSTLPYYLRPVQFFVVAAILPVCARLIAQGTPLGTTMGGMLGLFVVMLLVSLQRLYLNSRETTRLQVENAVQSEALDATRQRLDLHLRNTPLGVIEWDPNGKVINWNPGAQRIFGYSAEEILGHGWERIIPESAMPHVKQVVDALLSNTGGERSTNANVTRDGRAILCEWYNTPLVAEDGTVLGIGSLAMDVTERAMTQAALRENEDRFRALMENAADGFLLHDAEGRFLDVNRQACSSLGYSREELLSMRVPDVEVGVDPAMLGELWPHMERGEAVTLQGLHRRKDGSTFPVEVRLSAIERKGEKLVVVVARDISERLRAQSALRESEERLRFLLSSAPVVIYTCSLEEHFPATYVGPNVSDMLGYPPEKFLDDPLFWSSGIHPEDRERVFRDLQALFAHGTHEHEYRFRRGDGSYIWVYDELRLLYDPEGHPREIIGYWADVSRRKGVEFALVEARREAEYASQTKTRFLSRMSHELRTPLNGILGFAQLLNMDRARLSPNHVESVEQILTGGNYLLNLINDLLDLSKLDIGEMPLSIDAVPLEDVVESCVRLVQPVAGKRNIRIHADGYAGVSVTADLVRLKQVLLNLLSNSVKYNRTDGDVYLTVQREPEGWVRLALRDTGPGIEAEFQQYLFQPFRRALPMEDSVEGTGIGLSISRKLVELMGGRIGCDSAPGEGATFWVELRAATPHLEEVEISGVEATQASDTDAWASGVRPIAVLQVEDNPSNRLLMQEILSRVPGLTLHSARTGEEGVRMAREHRPDLVLLDMNLPDMTGFDVFTLLRTLPEMNGVPVVAVSADSLPDQVQRALHAGFDDYLCKPYRVEGVFKVIEKVAGQSTGGATPQR